MSPVDSPEYCIAASLLGLLIDAEMMFKIKIHLVKPSDSPRFAEMDEAL